MPARAPSAEPLGQASILPSRFCLDQAMMELERERIFGRPWQLVAHWDAPCRRSPRA